MVLVQQVRAADSSAEAQRLVAAVGSSAAAAVGRPAVAEHSPSGALEH
jgi:hypothetical protein